MKYKKLLYLSIFIIFLVSLNFYVITHLSTTNNFFVHKVKNLMPQSSRDFLKKINKKVKNIIFVFDNNKILKSKIDNRNIKIYDILDSIQTFDFTLDSQEMIKDNEYKLTRYTNILLPEMGPRSYLALYKDVLVLMTGSGTLMQVNINDFKNDNITFKKIESNFNQLVMSKFKDGRKTIVKNILIDNGQIYVSYLKKVNEECVKLAVLSSELNFDELNFIEFFELDICQPYGGQMIGTGGNLSKFKNNKILLTVGGFESYEVQKNDNPQKLDNMIGKILSIDKKTKKVNILSLGHRNSQGLFYDEFDDVIYSTDHGPKGGDEINLDLTPDHKDPKNFGWAVSSYGEHYSFPDKWLTEGFYKRAPLHKSHSEFGFIEPLKYFTPSIGITQIIKTEKFENLLNKKVIYVGSMGWDLDENDLSIHKFVLNDNYKIESHEVIPIVERIRDLIYDEKTNKILMFLETSGSIGILEKIS
jgi:hypothetical protein